MRQVQTASGSMDWGIVTEGCRPPVFTVTVNWEENYALGCSRPVVMVTDIKPETEFQCMVQFSNPMLLSMPSPYAANIALGGFTFAVASKLGGRIQNSESHVKNIMACIFPTTQQQFYKWGKYSPLAPGACMPCAQQHLSSGAAPVARPCNTSAGELADCCYSCRAGYTSLQNKCVATCAAGKVYDNPLAARPQCIKCSAGKFTAAGGQTCVTCSTLGFANAYGDAGGCVECGGRSLATGDSVACPGCYTACKACPAQQFVPVGGLVCQECQPGSRLTTTPPIQCVPCSVGFYEEAGRCLLCPSNTFKAAEGAGSCLPCASGMQSQSSRSACVACTDINGTLTPFTIYQPNVSGCAAMCDRTRSFAQVCVLLGAWYEAWLNGFRRAPIPTPLAGACPAPG